MPIKTPMLCLVIPRFFFFLLFFFLSFFLSQGSNRPKDNGLPYPNKTKTNGKFPCTCSSTQIQIKKTRVSLPSDSILIQLVSTLVDHLFDHPPIYTSQQRFTGSSFFPCAGLFPSRLEFLLINVKKPKILS